MKIKYDSPKGQRIKKGTFKSKGRQKRISIFHGLTTISYVDNCWWCEELNKWETVEKVQGHDFSNYNNDIKSLKSAIRHIKKHPELVKETILELSSNLQGYNITITV